MISNWNIVQMVMQTIALCRLICLITFFGLSPCAVVFAAQADIQSTVVEITDHRLMSTLGALFVGGA
jgi:hypothetical protein